MYFESRTWERSGRISITSHVIQSLQPNLWKDGIRRKFVRQVLL